MLSALRNWKSWLLILATAGLFWGETAWCVEKIRQGLSTRNVVLMPFYYARDKKLFDKYGLDVEIIQIRSNLQLAGLVAGELDFITGIDGPKALSKKRSSVSPVLIGQGCSALSLASALIGRGSRIARPILSSIKIKSFWFTSGPSGVL